MNEYRGLNIILISEGYESIYSGMTPGYIKKFYSLEDISIDLQRLCYNAGATFIKDKVINLDCENRKGYLKNNPSVSFDILSINSGSISNNRITNLNNESKIISVKPINSPLTTAKSPDESLETSLYSRLS